MEFIYVILTNKQIIFVYYMVIFFNKENKIEIGMTLTWDEKVDGVWWKESTPDAMHLWYILIFVVYVDNECYNCHHRTLNLILIRSTQDSKT